MPHQTAESPVMPEALDPGQFCTRRQAAKYLHVSQATLHRWMIERIGPSVIRLAAAGRGRVLYRVKELQQYVDDNTIRPKSESPAPTSRRKAGKAAAK